MNIYLDDLLVAVLELSVDPIYPAVVFVVTYPDFS